MSTESSCKEVVEKECSLVQDVICRNVTETRWDLLFKSGLTSWIIWSDVIEVFKQILCVIGSKVKIFDTQKIEILFEIIIIIIIIVIIIYYLFIIYC